MKTEVLLRIDDSQASVSVHGKITAGAVGIPVIVTIEGERWEGLAPKFVASCGGVEKECAVVEGMTTLPWECLISKKKLYIAIDGVSTTGSPRIPTILAYCGEVYPSAADIHPTNVTEPTADMVDQILTVANNAERIASDVEQRANNNEFDGFSPTVTVDEIDGGHKVTVTDIGGRHDFDVMDGVIPSEYVTSVNNKSGTVTITYSDLEGTPDIPTKVSELDNDSGFLTEEMADDEYAKISDVPDVPDWSMKPTKPTYTAREVGTYPITVLTKAEYDSIAIKSDQMVYFIVEG